MSNRFDRVACLTWGFVGLGVLVRLVRYLVVYPIWHDEAFLAVNFLDRGYLDLLRPLDYSQVSPILFLWIELTAVRLLGFSEWSLRLFPAFCGLMGVFLFRYVAARLLRGMAVVFAVGVFATAFYPIRHSAEVKPYSSDLFSVLVLLSLAVTWWRSPGQSRWWWILCVVAPVLLALSYPAIFVAAGLSVALGTKARSGSRPRGCGWDIWFTTWSSRRRSSAFTLPALSCRRPRFVRSTAMVTGAIRFRRGRSPGGSPAGSSECTRARRWHIRSGGNAARAS